MTRWDTTNIREQCLLRGCGDGEKGHLQSLVFFLGITDLFIGHRFPFRSLLAQTLTVFFSDPGEELVNGGWVGLGNTSPVLSEKEMPPPFPSGHRSSTQSVLHTFCSKRLRG